MEKPSPGEPCGACQTCRQIERMQYADLAVVQGEDGSALKVGQVRQLQKSLMLAPYAAITAWRFCLISRRRQRVRRMLF